MPIGGSRPARSAPNYSFDPPIHPDQKNLVSALHGNRVQPGTMQKEIERKTVTTKRESITVCDKCGLEATNPRNLFRDVKTRVHDNSLGEEAIQYAAELMRTDTKHRMAHAHQVRVEPGSAVIEELRDYTPDVELCSDCYDEVLGWGSE